MSMYVKFWYDKEPACRINGKLKKTGEKLNTGREFNALLTGNVVREKSPLLTVNVVMLRSQGIV